MLSVEKSIFNDTPSQATQDFSISFDTPVTRPFTFGVSQDGVMSALPAPINYSTGFDNLSVTDGGELIYGIGFAVFVGFEIEFNATTFHRRFSAK